MAYKEFSYFYDFFNENADYDKLFGFINNWIINENIDKGILCDLGCGTGEMAFRFDEYGYDVIAVDNSMEMLDVLYDKKYELSAENVLVLNQDITKLDMYGTVEVFICTFDTVNHLNGESDVQALFNRVSLFMEDDGVFIFDMNTEYKHKNILGNNMFNLEKEEAKCIWTNTLDEANKKTKITISIEDNIANEKYYEEFYECYYTLENITKLLKNSNLKIEKIVDGETFTEVKCDTQRYLIMAKKEQ